VLNGNGRTPEEAAWIAEHGIHSVNADHVAELDLLEAHASRGARPIRVALRVNPDIETHGHPTSRPDTTRRSSASAQTRRSRPGRPARAGRTCASKACTCTSARNCSIPRRSKAPPTSRARWRTKRPHAGTPLAFVNMGGGFGVDYTGAAEFPLETYARRLADRAADLRLEWVLEPGRWIVASLGVLLAEVLWVKRRDGQRFVVLAAGMNDLIRPALYGARHRIVPLAPRPGARESATVVGPVCESSDQFSVDEQLPPLESGDVVAILDAGAYGAAMSSNYNGRGRLAEVVASGGTLRRARAGETAADLATRATSDTLPA
jgi:diaminopimelate decarboxylase